MKVSAALLLLLFAFILSNAQDKKPQIYSWLPDAKNADSYFLEGVEIKTLYGPDVVVSLALVEDAGNYTQFMVGVKNNGADRILVSPHMARLTTLAPKREELWSELDEKVASSIEKRNKWRNLLESFVIGGATRQSRAVITDEYGNRVSVQITEPDYEAQQAARDARNRQQQQRSKAANIVRQFSLKKNTLFAGDEVVGSIFFKRKKFDKGILLLLIGGNFYEFPIVFR